MIERSMVSIPFASHVASTCNHWHFICNFHNRPILRICIRNLSIHTHMVRPAKRLKFSYDHFWTAPKLTLLDWSRCRNSFAGHGKHISYARPGLATMVLHGTAMHGPNCLCCDQSDRWSLPGRTKTLPTNASKVLWKWSRAQTTQLLVDAKKINTFE